MCDKEIVIAVGLTGEVKQILKGFRGKGCTKIADIIATVGKEVGREKTSEYYLAGGAPEGVLVNN